MHEVCVERLEPALHSVAGAIVEMIGLLVQGLQEGSSNMNSTAWLENTVNLRCDPVRIAVMLKGIHHHYRIEAIVFERQVVGVAHYIRVPEHRKFDFDDMIELVA